MKKLHTALVILILLSLLCLTMPNFTKAAAPNGDIISNTTWTRSSSPYKLTGPVTIQNGATLTIEPGVTVDLNNQYIRVYGTLIARGQPNNNIIITSSGTGQYINFNTASTNSIIENAIIEKCYIYIENGSPTINNNIFRNLIDVAINAPHGASTISNNQFTELSYYCAIIALDSQTVTNNRIYGSYWQYGIQAGGTTHVSKNWVTECWGAIKASGNSVIEGNTLINTHNRGIDCPDVCATTIKNNYIANNPYGIVGGGTIEANTIYNNEVGLQITFSASLKDNNIINNTKNSIVMMTAENIHAVQNWWGTTNTQTIRQSIQEYGTQGTVSFNPILTQHSASAPTNGEIDFSAYPTGVFSIFTDYNMQSSILTVAQIVAVTLAVVWGIVGTLLLVKRFKVTRRNP